MIRKFECKNCKNIFEADDAGHVECPKCHSDNVDFSSKNKISKAVKGLLAVAILLAIVGGVVYFLPNSSEKEPINDNSEFTGDTILVEPPTVEVSEPIYDDKKECYSVDVIAKNVPRGMEVSYVRMDHFGNHDVLQTSTDGKFTDIPYCEDDGHCYDFAIMDVKADTLLCAAVPKPGFIRVVVVKEKMSKEELQQLINKHDSSLIGAGENDFLAPDVTLKFKGLPEDAVNIPENLSSVFEKIDFGIWTSVTVDNLKWDDKNRISEITLIVKTE